ncbi:serine/threonine-protein kinase Nek9-like isoform X2 [Paramacrobiotus metropolitanus]|uniref:serine/threonine-protein kinase Nek9-like isoform X2 n=1 Tax=Paramacrobiotus metropolitanus TaxID=2943436 RepID=UPI002445C5C9|nr:serine/threonine-protein kinase Nek9-like isoform X2 [Paramacrobiotus metropolitanus]
MYLLKKIVKNSGFQNDNAAGGIAPQGSFEIVGYEDAAERIYDDDTTETNDNDDAAEVMGRNMQYRYSNVDYIGRGSFGVVYKAKVTKRGSYTGEQIIAVKVIHAYNHSTDAEEKERWTNALTRLRRLTELSHKHLVVYHKVSITPASGGVIAELVMDYYKGDLASFLKDTKENEDLRNSFNYRKVIKFTIYIARGLEYLHRNGIIHGDLKPENILVQIAEGGREKLRIGDLDDLIQMHQSHTCSEDFLKIRGTTRYMSPEMLIKFIKTAESLPPGRKTDIWSLGCIILEMAECSKNVSKKQLVMDANVVDGGSEISETQYATLIIDGYVPFVDGAIEENLGRVIQQCLRRTVGERICVDALLSVFKIQKKQVILFFPHPGHIDQVLIFNPSTSSFTVREVLGSPAALWGPYAVLAGPKSEVIFVQRVKTRAGSANNVFHFWNLMEGRWREITPSRQSSFSEAIVVKHRVYLRNKMKFFAEMDAFTGRIASLKTPRKAYHLDPSAVAKCGKYIFYVTWDCLLRYNTENHEWRSLPNLPEKRWDFAVAVVNGYMYVIGGKVPDSVGGDTDRIATADCIRLNLDAPDPTWENMSLLAQPRYWHAACVVQDRIYVCGGRHAAEQHALAIEFYDTNNDAEWSIVSLLEKDEQMISNFAANIKPGDPWYGVLSALTVDLESEIVINISV